EPDVLKYLDDRVMIVEGAHAQLAGLPPREKQGEIIARLLETFEAETLAHAGLLNRYKNGKIETPWFWCPDHRLLIPWRALDGSTRVLQRRRLTPGEPKYVFPRGRKPAYPFGAEALRVTDASWPIVFCEGALDVLALRLIGHRDRALRRETAGM